MADRIAVMDAGPDRPARRALRDLRPPGDAVRRRLHRRHEPPRGHARARRRAARRHGRAAPASASAASCARPRSASASGSACGPRRSTPTRRGEGTPATCQTAMVLGHNLQIVAVLETGEEVVARQRRAGDESLERASRRATSCGSAGARPRRCCSAPRTARRDDGGRSRSNCRPDLRKEATSMPDRPDELNILVPESSRRSRRSAWSPGARRCSPAAARRWPRTSPAAAARPAAASGGGGGGGGGEESRGREAADAGRRPGRGRRPAAGELGRLLRPRELQGLHEGVRAEGQGLRLRLQRRDPRQAARRRLEVRRDLPHRLRGQDDGRPRADHAAHARADPEHQEPLARVHEDRLRPGQQVLGAEGLRHHELLLADRQGLRDADDDRGELRAAQDARSSRTCASTSSRAGRRSWRSRWPRSATRSTPRTRARSTRPSSCWSTSSRTSTRSTRRSSSAPRAARSTSAWAGTATSGARSRRWPRRTARWSSSCPRARPSTGSTTGSSRPTPSTRSPRTSGSTSCSTRSTRAGR